MSSLILFLVITLPYFLLFFSWELTTLTPSQFCPVSFIFSQGSASVGHYILKNLIWIFECNPFLVYIIPGGGECWKKLSYFWITPQALGCSFSQSAIHPLATAQNCNKYSRIHSSVEMSHRSKLDFTTWNLGFHIFLNIACLLLNPVRKSEIFIKCYSNVRASLK